MHLGFDFALGKNLCPEEFTQEMQPEHRRAKAAYRPLGKFIPNPKFKLREQVAEVCRFRHLSVRTEIILRAARLPQSNCLNSSMLMPASRTIAPMV